MTDWISVDDRLPETEATVIGYDPVCGVREVTFGFLRDASGHYFNDAHLGWEGELVTDCLTHWQPLPDPPEAKP